MKKRLLCCLMTLLLCFALSLSVPAAVDLSRPDYVVDDANVLSDSTEELVRSINAALEQQCRGAQFVVVTTPYAPRGMDQQEFANELFNTWNPGDAAENNGFVLVLYTEKNEFWVECGEGIMNACYDELADIFSDRDDDFSEYVAAGKFDKAVEEALEETAEVLYDHYSVSGHGSAEPAPYPSPEESSRSGAGLDFILLIVILLFLLGRRTRRRGGSGLLPFLLGLSAGRRRGSSFDSTPTYRSSPRSGGSFRSGGGFGSSSHGSGSFRSGGSFRGGGGHSGGGFGKR